MRPFLSSLLKLTLISDSGFRLTHLRFLIDVSVNTWSSCLDRVSLHRYWWTPASFSCFFTSNIYILYKNSHGRNIFEKFLLFRKVGLQLAAVIIDPVYYSKLLIGAVLSSSCFCLVFVVSDFESSNQNKELPDMWLHQTQDFPSTFFIYTVKTKKQKRI